MRFERISAVIMDLQRISFQTAALGVHSSGQLIAPCWSLAVAIPDLYLPVVHRDGTMGLQLLLDDLVDRQYSLRRHP